MAVRHHRELIAWQLADQFKKEVFRLLESSPAALSDFRYRSQLVDSSTSVTANLVEGFRRFSPGEFPRFIDYSLASLGEAEQRLRDGIELGISRKGLARLLSNWLVGVSLLPSG